MKIILRCLSFFLLISCIKEKKENIFFNETLYHEVIKYQKNHPIPKNDFNVFSLYKISFSKKMDTLLTITVSPNGIHDKNSFGIYKDDKLKSSYIIDNQKLGRRFIKDYKKDSIESYILQVKPPHTDIFYPVYKYKVKKDKLIFIDSLR